MTSLPPLSLYIHIPWCVRKCPYCDFNSHEHTDIPESSYLSALLQDFKGDLIYLQNRPITSIFIGGGTPSLMSGKFYADLLSSIASETTFSKDIEITLEANPGTAEAERFKAYRQAGINRLSMGVQSFQNHLLENLGRIHNSDESINAFHMARAAGFQNINLDLMHGLPDQDLDLAIADLRQAIELAPEHLSWYQLTIEQNTEFYSHPPVLPEDEMLWDIQEAGFSMLEQAGYHQYEVSAFAKATRQAKHNLNYWQFGDYIGIGAGAHSKITVNNPDNESKHILRYRKSRTPKDYLKPKPFFRVGENVISKDELAFEFLMNVLRLKEGVDSRLFQERTQLALASLEPKLSQLRQQGLMHPSRLQTTEKGHLFLNTILEQFTD